MGTYIDFDVKNNKDLKFKFSDHVGTTKYKNIFPKGYSPNWSQEMFISKKVKNTVQWKYMTEHLNGNEIVATFYEKDLQITNQTGFLGLKN